MASKIHSRRWLDKPLHGDGARVLLVIKNPEDLSYYGAILQKLRCQVRSSPSVTEGARCIQREPCDLIILDQGSSRIEERQLLMTAMEVDTEVPVLVLARSYDKGCYEEAMQSGALDYIEGPLSEAEIVAFLETYVPRPTGSYRSLPTRSTCPISGPRKERSARFQQPQLAGCAPATSGGYIA